MKKILIFTIAIAMFSAHAIAAVRDGNTAQRGTSQKRISTTVNSERTTTSRTGVLIPTRGITERTTTGRTQQNVINRTSQSPQPITSISSRAATKQTQNIVSETRTGVAYETCKSAFFTCMDQFCALKNDDYRRCSCSSRIATMENQRATLNDAGQQLTVFTENLDVVGLNAAQATAMKTASEGENALSTDTSASKALLQAIMNSISGGDTTVSGKYSELNTINMSYDLTTAFGADANQIVASYNGQELYSAVYPQCRHAVAADCNNASLQRAVNAYLMAIEQDCNTVQTAIDERRSQMKSAIREGSAMLDLARVENRRKHNSDDMATCVNNVEAAILSEDVCGANYHKCLDNGEFIDITTGAPITGVAKFYELGQLLTFAPGVDAANQQLSKRANNRTFVANFENRTKKFAGVALDKCAEMADEVWATYLDKALLAIYYGQQAKVADVKQGCFDLVSSCYMDSDASITAAMAKLVGAGLTILQPDKIALTTQMCADYVDSCNNMFREEGAGNIVEQYVNNRQDTDTLAACRAVVKQCFDKYGGDGYENFYYPYSGLFQANSPTGTDAITPGDWFTLYDGTNGNAIKSPCAKQLTEIDACKDRVEEAFGGFDKMKTTKDTYDQYDQLQYSISNAEGATIRYGFVDDNKMKHRVLRPTGVATEVYYQIIDALTTQCTNIGGRFVERQFIKENLYGGKNKNNICLWYPQSMGDNPTVYNNYIELATKMYGIFKAASNDDDTDSNSIPDDFYGENMCPRDYGLKVDTSFWGACLCWENGARRSKNGKNATCVPELPAAIKTDENNTGDNEQQANITDNICYKQISENQPHDGDMQYNLSDSQTSKFNFWCTQSINAKGQTCPYGYTAQNGKTCANEQGDEPDADVYKLVPESILSELKKSDQSDE